MSRSTKGRQFLPDIFTDAEVQLLLRQCNVRYPTGCRNQALIAVLYRSGIRISEALGLVPKDVVIGAGELRVHWGKGGRSRVVGIDVGAMGLLERWLTMRRELVVPAKVLVKSPVFCTLRGGELKQQYVQEMLRRLGAKAGIEKRIHAHGFRHTFAAQMLAEGADIGTISKQLGHASIATTARYLDHISPQQVVNWVSGRKWEMSGKEPGEKPSSKETESDE